MPNPQPPTDQPDPWSHTQPRRLLITFFGLYVRTGADWVSVAALIRLMGDLGIGEQAVRSSISRLKRRGVLRSATSGGAAGYTPSPRLREALAEGDQRIFGRRRATVDDGWVIVVFSVPERERRKRHELRMSLTSLGFGMIAPGAWVAPGNLAAETHDTLRRHGLGDYVDVIKGEFLVHDLLAHKLRQWWDLEELSAQYHDFIRFCEPLAARLHKVSRDARASFVEYTRLVTSWRRLPYLDPGLPIELLPGQWPGAEASELFRHLHEQLAEPARQHAMDVIESSSPPAATSVASAGR